MRTLWDDGLAKVAAGLTSIEELARAAGAAPAKQGEECTWGASSVVVEEVNGQLVQSEPATTGCTPG